MKKFQTFCALFIVGLVLIFGMVTMASAAVNVRVQPSGNDAASAYVLINELRTYFGNVEGVMKGLRRAYARGYDHFHSLETDPAWASVRDHPEFRALVHEMAGDKIERARRKRNPIQMELRGVGHAHIARGEHVQALAVLERALELGGPQDAEIRAEVAALRAAIEAGTPELVRLGATGEP